jgi:hypothetical protein
MRETKKVQKAWEQTENRMKIESRKGDLRRARSVSVGTCFGGTTELMMRGNDGNVIWAIMQPVEVIELIHQLAANVGCHIHIQPRNDFASWRDWKLTPEEKLFYSKHPPFVNSIKPFMNLGANLPAPEEQPGLQPSLMAKDKQNETVATEKPKNRRNSKRTAAAS